MISVDTKKDLASDLRKAALGWRPKDEPAAGARTTFPQGSLGEAVSYGIYDLAGNTG